MCGRILGTCRDWDCGIDEPAAITVADELVAHAISRSTQDLHLRLELRRGLLTIAVTYAPTVPDAPLDQIRRRIVSEVADVWGASATARGDQLIWAVLRVAAPSSGW
ncbi:hypothetical protein F1D05_21250 [Kribbella qitaiheensis]|uniref:ATP-binding protein n=1 Tax=Kribbella qitaiheensis TaxID=1544730 RepID=A0A7G6X159_9ACTN|nr:hypothetical protein [Kribbella qitaiheensis]QNE19974.1 hypothetical protein F1D05_21250 [Kribbella qitaiheensis]